MARMGFGSTLSILADQRAEPLGSSPSSFFHLDHIVVGLDELLRVIFSEEFVLFDLLVDFLTALGVGIEPAVEDLFQLDEHERVKILS